MDMNTIDFNRPEKRKSAWTDGISEKAEDIQVRCRIDGEEKWVQAEELALLLHLLAKSNL